MIIDIRAINESESLFISGTINEDIWELQDSDLVQPTGQLKYSGDASIVSGELLVTGDFSAKFTFSVHTLLSFIRKNDISQ